MTNNEEIDRKMNFIVEQQAQFAVDIQLLKESQAKTAENLAKTELVVAQVVTGLGEANVVITSLARVTHAGFTDINIKLNAVVDAQIRTAENVVSLEKNVTRLEGNVTRLEGNVTRLEGNVTRLEEKVSRTSESVSKLEAMVERFFKNRRNGN